MLLVAAVLTVLIGFAHSILGEKFILNRLFKLELPKLKGSDWFTKMTLRFAWHITTLAWWGFAALMLMAQLGVDDYLQASLWVMASVFTLSGLVSAYYVRFQHFSWFVFLLIGAACAVQALV